MSVDEHVGRVQPVAAIFCVLGIASVVTTAVVVSVAVVVTAVGVLLVPEHQCGRHGRWSVGRMSRFLSILPNPARKVVFYYPKLLSPN